LSESRAAEVERPLVTVRKTALNHQPFSKLSHVPAVVTILENSNNGSKSLINIVPSLLLIIRKEQLVQTRAGYGRQRAGKVWWCGFFGAL
jgi:hypothetical protein